MASLTKLSVFAFVLILLSSYGVWGTSASSLHQREKLNSRWFSDCRTGHRKMANLNCESADVLINMKRTPYSQILKTALSPPPAPVKRVASRYKNVAPPPPNI